jgi:GNAT superfamily N-acetyltransferase
LYRCLRLSASGHLPVVQYLSDIDHLGHNGRHPVRWRNAVARGESDGVEIRPVGAEDVDAFLALIEALAHYEQLDPPDADARARLARDVLVTPPRFWALIATLHGEPAGYAVFFETYSTFLAQPTLYLEDLFVQPAARAQGVGRTLFHACAREAVRRGCGRMEWQVLRWNDLALGFYDHLGATPLHADWQSYRLSGEALAALGPG